jgi:choline dehydrogenase-like flavoprotein
MVPSLLPSAEHDVVVVGTGIGGATLGYALSGLGRSILFLEQGRDLSQPGIMTGSPAEAAPGFSPANQLERLAASGRSPERFEDGVTGESFIPYIGYGTGGSSSLYGMALERRLPHDFENWPISYDELAPYYTAAESLYEVTGSVDPLGAPDPLLGTPPPLSPANETIFEHLRARGLHPYRLHLASRRLEGCRLCQGYLCPSAERCKNDARTACLTPALAAGAGTRLMTETRALQLETSGRRVIAVHATSRGQDITFRAKIVVLAAGALSTPRILLASGGLANASGLVGRRLMRHAITLCVLTLGPRFEHAGHSKELGMNDFYLNSLGTVQSFGMAPPLEYLRNQPGRNLWKMIGPAAVPLARVFARAPIVAGILDDQPQVENCIELGTSGVPRIHYRLSRSDRTRRLRLHRAMMTAFARFGPVPVFGTTDLKALGHVCGTTAFGDDPRASVLDRNNRVHDLDNLYVVDASFFPTSGGANPALTVAANALRVARHLEQVL